ncbi:hypothetical protein H6G89_17485 [Oscillatoria sp. FACHB-1407]|uniref:hypothetical protein n=1 Tax=Oscillatoria sp. FACHB-1407 TaxID=2692847 RepID=UPI001687D9A5|nr:hypothetical protein [Oscillatoria sp. FACHB-1407]MBD2462835.1 hypothetical protein [Oscillatoria sp. FACHB-1407]
MNSRLLERSPPTRTPENAEFDELTQVGFAPIAAVKTAAILIPNSRCPKLADQTYIWRVNPANL